MEDVLLKLQAKVEELKEKDALLDKLSEMGEAWHEKRSSDFYDSNAYGKIEEDQSIICNAIDNIEEVIRFLNEDSPALNITPEKVEKLFKRYSNQ